MYMDYCGVIGEGVVVGLLHLYNAKSFDTGVHVLGLRIYRMCAVNKSLISTVLRTACMVHSTLSFSSTDCIGMAFIPSIVVCS